MNAIAKPENAQPVALPANQTVTPLDMLNLAITKGTSMEQLEKLMDLKERWDANEAKKAYVVAMSAFKANPPIVIKDMLNKQYNSRYSSLGNFVNTVNPELSRHGLSAKWEIDQSSVIKVSCVMTHVQGHSESASMEAPADTSGQKNPIQQIKSTVTYLELATFQAITGLVSSDATMDDDGNANNGLGLSESVFADFRSAIEALSDKPAAESLWKKIAAACKETGDKTSYNVLKKDMTARVSEIEAGK